MSKEWDAPPATPASVGDIELIVNLPASGSPADATAMANAQLLDADGNEIDRRYVRDTDKLKALLNQGNVTALGAILRRLRDKAEEMLLP